MRFSLNKVDGRGWPAYLPGGRVRTSTAVLIVTFIALFWVQQSFQPEPEPPAPTTQVVPPGFVPDPDYTWVPRTNVREWSPTTTPTTTTTTTTSPTETTSPTSPTSPAPTTTVTDPDGPGPLAPQTQTLTPTPTSTPTITAPPGPAPEPTTPPPPS